jgi:hypothetical protein
MVCTIFEAGTSCKLLLGNICLASMPLHDLFEAGRRGLSGPHSLKLA